MKIESRGQGFPRKNLSGDLEYRSFALTPLSDLPEPALSSEGVKLRRSEYYAKLTSVRERGEYAEWIEFFCGCLLRSAEDAIGAMELLVGLHDRNMSRINAELGRSASNGQRLLGLIEGNPIIDINFVSERLEIARTTAANLVKSFCELGILVQPETERQRYRAYMYEDYLAILRRGGDPL